MIFKQISFYPSTRAKVSKFAKFGFVIFLKFKAKIQNSSRLKFFVLIII